MQFTNLLKLPDNAIHRPDRGITY